MGCICKVRTGVLACINCGARATVQYEKDEETPLEAAKKMNKKCSKCGGTEFEIKRG